LADVVRGATGTIAESAPRDARGASATSGSPPEHVVPPPGRLATGVPAPWSFSLSTLMLLTTLCAAVLGLAAAAPGLGVFAGLFLMPALVRTLLVVRRREALGERVSAGQKAALTATSFVVASTFAWAVAAALFCCFCGVCLLVIGAADTQGSLAITGLVVTTLGIALAAVVIRRLLPWIRRRYRRDARLEDDRR
jgi:hypothetical protein